MINLVIILSGLVVTLSLGFIVNKIVARLMAARESKRQRKLEAQRAQEFGRDQRLKQLEQELIELEERENQE